MSKPIDKPAAAVALVVADAFELAGLFRRHGEVLAAKAGQTQARWQVLSAASAEPKTVPQIARRLGVTRQNVQRIADRLVQEGSARFADNPDHSASPHLTLTAEGRAALADLSAQAERYHATIAERLGGADLLTVFAATRKLLAVLKAIEIEPLANAQDGAPMEDRNGHSDNR